VSSPIPCSVQDKDLALGSVLWDPTRAFGVQAPVVAAVSVLVGV
jgi:hypothetical protein